MDLGFTFNGQQANYAANSRMHSTLTVTRELEPVVSSKSAIRGIDDVESGEE